jgi:hypothetical protein
MKLLKLELRLINKFVSKAKALSAVGSKINMMLYGTPEQAAKIFQGIMTGQNVAETVNSFAGNISPEIKNTLSNLIKSIIPKENEVLEVTLPSEASLPSETSKEEN